jgi:hypothetical protein
MNITTIQGLVSYLTKNSAFSDKTINAVITALGYNPSHGTQKEFRELSQKFKEVSEHGADCGWSGFTYYTETIAFYKKHRQDIVQHMEQNAAGMGTDIISMVQSFGDFRNSDKPTPSEVGRALWDSQTEKELTSLYNVFSWYALEEVARTWYRYLEDHPSCRLALSA